MAANNLEEDEFDQDYDNENNDDLTNEEDIIRFYFYQGFNYEEILKFLQKYHDKEMSLSIGGPIQCVVSYRDQCALKHIHCFLNIIS